MPDRSRGFRRPRPTVIEMSMIATGVASFTGTWGLQKKPFEQVERGARALLVMDFADLVTDSEFCSLR